MLMNEVFIATMVNIANTLRWALLYLIDNPQVQEMLHEEFDQVVGSTRFPDIEDKNNLGSHHPCMLITFAFPPSSRCQSLVKLQWTRHCRDITFLKTPPFLPKCGPFTTTQGPTHISRKGIAHNTLLSHMTFIY